MGTSVVLKEIRRLKSFVDFQWYQQSNEPREHKSFFFFFNLSIDRSKLLLINIGRIYFDGCVSRLARIKHRTLSATKIVQPAPSQPRGAVTIRKDFRTSSSSTLRFL